MRSDNAAHNKVRHKGTTSLDVVKASNDVLIPENKFSGEKTAISGGLSPILPGASKFDAGLHAETRRAHGPVTVARTTGERRYSVFRGIDVHPVAVWTAAELRAYRETAEARQAFARVGAAPDKATKDAIKSGLLRYTPAGEFPYRNNDSLTVYTGEVILDVDAPTDWLGPRIAGIAEALCGCPHISDVSYSAGGRLHVRVRTAAPHSGLHGQAFRAARAAVVAIYPELDEWIDKSGATLSQPFICAAPNLWYNDDAPPLPVAGEPVRAPRNANDAPEPSPEFATAVCEAFTRFADAKPDAVVNEWDLHDRRTWVGAAFAFADAVRQGADERAAFHAFDAVSRCAGGKYGRTDAQWRDALQGAARDDGATFGTVVYKAQRLGILPGAARRQADTPESLRRQIWGEVNPECLYVERYGTEVEAGFLDFVNTRPAGACVGVEAVTGIGKTTLVCRYGLAKGRPGAPFLLVIPLSMQREGLRRVFSDADKIEIARRYGLVPDPNGRTPGVCFLSLADDTPDKQRAAGVETASLVILTYDAAAVYAGPPPCDLALDEVHEFVAAHGYRRRAVAGTMRLLSRIQTGGGRVILLSATMPQGLARTFALHSALSIIPEVTTAVDLQFRVYLPWTETSGSGDKVRERTHAARVNLYRLCDEIQAQAKTGRIQAVLLNGKNSLHAIQKELRGRGIFMPVIASDATGEDLAVMRYLEQNERLPDGVHVFGATSKLACGFNLYDERDVRCHIVDNGMFAAVGRTTPELAAQFVARFRGKTEVSVVWHTLPDVRNDKGEPARGPAFDRAFAAELAAGDRLCDAANAARQDKAAAEILELVTRANVVENHGRYYIDNVGVLSAALATGNRLRPLSDVEAALRVFMPRLTITRTDVPGEQDLLKDEIKRDKALQAGAAQVVIAWGAAFGQTGVRAMAYLAAERTGDKGKQQYRRLFGRTDADKPDDDDLLTLNALAVQGPDGTTTTVAELLDAYGADLILKFVARAHVLNQCGQDWRRSLLVVLAKAKTTALSRLRARIACACALCGFSAEGLADGRAGAQLAEMQRLVNALMAAHGNDDLTNEKAAQTINAAGGWFGEYVTPNKARHLLDKFGRVAGARRPQTDDDRKRMFSLRAEITLETICDVDDDLKLDADAFRKAAHAALTFAARAYNIAKTFLHRMNQTVRDAVAVADALKSAAQAAVTTTANTLAEAVAEPARVFDPEPDDPDPFPPPG